MSISAANCPTRGPPARESRPCGAVSHVAAAALRRRDRACAATIKREVAERLREVADLPLARDVVLLCEQAEVVAQAEQPLEQRARLVDAAVERERVDQPERAGQELAFVARQPVVGLGGRVARDEAVAPELARDRVDRSGDPLVVPGRKPTSGMFSTLASSSLDP